MFPPFLFTQNSPVRFQQMVYSTKIVSTTTAFILEYWHYCTKILYWFCSNLNSLFQNYKIVSIQQFCKKQDENFNYATQRSVNISLRLFAINSTAPTARR